MFDMPTQDEDQGGYERDAIPPGWYEATITDAEETEASTCTRQLKVVMDVDLPDGKKVDLWQWFPFDMNVAKQGEPKRYEPVPFGRKRIAELARATGALVQVNGKEQPDPSKMATERVGVKLAYKRGSSNTENSVVGFRPPQGGHQTSSQRRIAEKARDEPKRESRSRFDGQEAPTGYDDGPIGDGPDDPIPF